MTMLEILTNPIIWIIIIISGTLIMYYILSKSTPNDRKICDTDEEIIKGKCVTKCSSEQTRCGSSINCYDPVQQYCDITTSQICGISNQKCGKCCQDGSSCSEDGTCKQCESKLCGEKCCDKDTPYCCNNNECCKSENLCTTDGCCNPPNQVCGDNGGQCCSVKSGLNCIDNKCKIGCPSISPDGKLPDGFTLTPVGCDPDTDVCFQNPTITDVNKQYKCIPKGCDWGDIYYIPNIIVDSTNNPIHVCEDDSNNLWISKDNTTDLKSTVSVSIKNFDENKCTPDACIQKIYQDGSTQLKGLDGDPKIDNNNVCTSKLLCDKLLIPKNKLNLYCESSKDYDCCIDNNGYTGQVCMKGYRCNVNTCIKMGEKDPYCNNNGITSYDDTTKKIMCICNKPTVFYDINCMKRNSSDYFDSSYFKSYITINSFIGWNIMHIFIVSNNIKNWKIIPWVFENMIDPVTPAAKDILSTPVTQLALIDSNNIGFQIQDSSNNLIAWATYSSNGPGWTLNMNKQPGNQELQTSLPINYTFYNAGAFEDGSSPCFIIYASKYIDSTDDPTTITECSDYYNRSYFVNYITNINIHDVSKSWESFHVFIVCNEKTKWKIVNWIVIPSQNTYKEWSTDLIGVNGEKVEHGVYAYGNGNNNYFKTIGFQIKDSNGVMRGWATYDFTADGKTFWVLNTNKQSGNDQLQSQLPFKYVFYNSGDLFSGSAACLVIIASEDIL